MYKKTKHAQAAMEFLMTYGWAILVVLVVIGALAYYGVLQPDKFLPEKCHLGGELRCVDHIAEVRVDNGVVFYTFLLESTTESTLELQSVRIKDSGANCLMSNIPDNMKTIKPGKQTKIRIPCAMGEEVNLETKQKYELEFAYTDKRSNFDHTAAGTLLTILEVWN